MECNNCGGTDFYKEAGFFYCKECQIQSQDIQEHVFQDNVGEEGEQRQLQTKTSRKIQKDKNINEDKITSWEAYNYIILGLTEELINLGADRKLKQVVKILWLKYLEKLQVFKRGSNVLPKLQAVASAK